MTRYLFLCAVACTTDALALNPKNAGPSEVEIKFELPPPAPRSPEEAQRSFVLQEGYRIELVAAEPLVEAPVAISFDDQGRLYVVEMRGYMRDVKGSTEDEATGRIRLLEDTDGDGRMDKAMTFMDELEMPRSVMAVNGGVLVAVPPQLLFCKDTNGDGVADVKEVVTADFGVKGGQPEHMANTPVWSMDNHVWAAGYNSRLKLRGGVWMKDGGLGRGQYGLCQDDVGRLYYNYNSDLLRADLLPAEAFAKHPLLRSATSINSKLVSDQSVWPIHPTPGVNRGYDAKTLRSDGSLTRATASCGALIYRGDALPPDARGNAFIPEPAGNLVKRMKLTEQEGKLTASNVLNQRDFLTSTDERFRPVQAADGPDGALYIVDMYRGIIQHKSFLTHYLIANIADRQLEQPYDMGRIWRIIPDKAKRPQRTTLPVEAEGRVTALSHDNGWVRDTAQRLLVETAPKQALPLLAELIRSSESKPLARLHALWALDGMMALTPEVLRAAIKDGDARVRAAAMRMATRDVLPELLTMTEDQDALVRAQLAIKLSAWPSPETDTALAILLGKGGARSSIILDGALTGMRGREVAFATLLVEKTNPKRQAEVLPALEALASLIAQSNKAQPIEDLLNLAALRPKADTIQVALLNGLSKSSSGSKKGSSVPKLVWLEAEPTSLKTLETALKKHSASRDLSRVTDRIAWPGKPGAPKPPEIKPLNAEQTALFEKGRTIYTSLCGACHQPHGLGLDGLAPPLVDSEWVTGDPTKAALIVMHGIAGPLQVSGQTYNLAMPPLPHLTDEDVAAVLTYIRREWEHTASAVHTAFVTKVRDRHKGRTMMWTEAELKSKTRR
jgi:mono/diheme cytochrome c family protein/glucose/arabinose dehydrogenase